jgi:hypothetical protein
VKKILFISFLIVAVSASYGLAQMGGGNMMGGQGKMMEQTEQMEEPETSQQQHPCQTGPGMMGYGMRPGMMGSGMRHGGGMGYGMMPGYGCGMMGYGGHMRGYGMHQDCGMMGRGGHMRGYGMHQDCGMMGRGGHMQGYGMHQDCGMMGRGGHMMAPGYGGHMYGWKGGYDQKFLDETVDLRRELHNKKFEYFEAARKSETDPEAITNLEKEIQSLNEKLFEKDGRAGDRGGRGPCTH